MPASTDARREAFRQFVARHLARMKARHGWSIPTVARMSGVGVNTIYRWVRPGGGKAPEGDLIEAFCDVVGVDPAQAFAILWPGKHGKTKPTQPEPLEPDMEAILRKLNNPNVPDGEKYFIRETLQGLAARPDKPIGTRPRRS